MSIDHPKTALDHTLPVVNIGTKHRPIYIPAEHCNITGGQSYKKELDDNQQAEMRGFAVQRAVAAYSENGGLTSDGMDIPLV